MEHDIILISYLDPADEILRWQPELNPEKLTVID